MLAGSPVADDSLELHAPLQAEVLELIKNAIQVFIFSNVYAFNVNFTGNKLALIRRKRKRNFLLLLIRNPLLLC